MDMNKLPDSISIMGISITPFSSYLHACSCIENIINTKQKAFSVAINPEKINRSSYDDKLKTLLNRAEIGICDGIGAAIAVRFIAGKKIARITGISLFLALTLSAASKGWRIFLLGASPESNQGASEKLLRQYPGINIVGRIDGYFRDSLEVVRAINESNADIVFVAMGSPKQEIWIAEYRDMINAPFCMGVGGTFDVISGKVKWAPVFFRKTGTEWLYRLIREPKRWRRQLVLPKFVWMVFKQKIIGR